MAEFDLAENFVIRFINITRKKDGLHSNFRVKGIKNGVVVKASIAVELDAAGVDPSDPLETIIEQCSQRAVDEFKRAEFTQEGLVTV